MGGDEDSFRQRRYLWRQDSAKGGLRRRKVLSSSAAEAAAAAARMDFLSHPNSTGQRRSPQSGGIPPASDAAVAAAPRARLGETNCLAGGGRKGRYDSRGRERLLQNEDVTRQYFEANRPKLMPSFPKRSKTSSLEPTEMVSA